MKTSQSHYIHSYSTTNAAQIALHLPLGPFLQPFPFRIYSEILHIPDISLYFPLFLFHLFSHLSLPFLNLPLSNSSNTKAFLIKSTCYILLH